MNMQTMLLLGDLVGMRMEEVLTWVSNNFSVERLELENLECLVGQVDEGGYDGEAYFLFRNRETDQYFEVSGAHCSCFGFEGQWNPAITSKEYLLSEHYRMRGYPEIHQHMKNLFL